MTQPKHQYLLLITVSMLLLTGCYSLVFKPEDMRNIRRQLHLPRTVKFLAFDSNPKQPGFFGREGLQITAAVGFSEQELTEYTAHLNDAQVWTPVTYLSYSPSIGDEYTKQAFRWSDLPLPSNLQDRIGQNEIFQKSLDVEAGMFYCSVLVPERGEPLEHNPAAFEWNYLGKACLEISPSEFPVVLTFAVLDFEKHILHAIIHFSG